MIKTIKALLVFLFSLSFIIMLTVIMILDNEVTILRQEVFYLEYLLPNCKDISFEPAGFIGEEKAFYVSMAFDFPDKTIILYSKRITKKSFTDWIIKTNDKAIQGEKVQNESRADRPIN